MDDDLLKGALKTEFKTLKAMIEIYCKDKHLNVPKAHKNLCTNCYDLLDYAVMRLDRCPYGELKPTCNRCPIHCYKPSQKSQMRNVMIYAGPRMVFKHPILAIRHLLKEKKTAADKPKVNMSNRAKRKLEQESLKS